MTFPHRLIARAAAKLVVALMFVAASVSAQVLDTVDVTRDGANAVVRIHFATLIQYLRHTPPTEGSLIQAYFQITAGDEAVLETREDQRVSPPNDLVPPFTVTYPTQVPGLQRRIDIRFASPVRYRLRPEGNSSIVLIIPLSDEQIAKLTPPKPQGVKLPPSEVTVAPQTDLDRDASTLSRQARTALENGEFEQAVLALNRLLNLPPNPWSQDAQELIGVARAELGETTKAKAEFELYLKVYPDAAGAERVRQRLAALAAAPAAVPAAARPGALTYWGSVSQYYYGGQSRALTTTTTVTPATGATTIDTAALSSIDQSQLVNNVDLAARYRDANWDTRAVFRDSYTANFIGDAGNSNRLTALYVETKYQPAQLFGRFGRQSATTGGVLGRFDGAVGTWGVTQNWRVTAIAGQPVDVPTGTTKTFYGGNVDVENLATHWSGDIFAIRQVVGSIEDRTGVGGELRYFDPERNVYSLFDYDPTFQATNIAMIQGNWQFPTGTSISVLYDYRRTPTLQLTNALIGEPTGSIDALIQRLGESGARDLAKSLTPVSRVAFVGVTQQLSPRWQVGLDVRVSSVTGTAATPTLPASPATGNVYTYTAQAIGNGLTTWQDILVVNASVLTGKLFDAQQASLDYRFTPWPDIVIEPMFKWYRQTDTLNATLTRTVPGLKLVWRIKDRFSIEAEGDIEQSKNKTPLIVDTVTRHFYYIGWRWDL